MISRFDNLPIILLLLFISSYSFGQKWSYQGHDKTEKFGHEYWFSFQNEDDTSSYKFDYSSLEKDSNNIEIIVLSNDGKPLPFAILSIRSNFSDQYLQVICGSEGKTVINQKSGKIEITAKSIQFDDFQVILDLDSNQKLNLTINLGKSPELKVFQIKSKRKLSNTLIEEIIDCVKNERKINSNFGCERKREYYISIHI